MKALSIKIPELQVRLEEITETYKKPLTTQSPVKGCLGSFSINERIWVNIEAEKIELQLNNNHCATIAPSQFDDFQKNWTNNKERTSKAILKAEIITISPRSIINNPETINKNSIPIGLENPDTDLNTVVESVKKILRDSNLPFDNHVRKISSNIN